MPGEAARTPYTPPTPQEADRHAAYAADILDYFEAGDRRGADQLMRRLHADLTIDPWTLCLGVAAWAVRPRRRRR